MLVGTRVTSSKGNITVAVLVDGQEQPLYRRFDGRYFVAGLPGEEYVLYVHNVSKGRVEVINTVDGRNTLKDEPGDAQANRGMIFGSCSSGEFTGWRLNGEKTRAFVFGMPDESIATQVGAAGNVGVIGFAVYREQSRPGFGDLLGSSAYGQHQFGGGEVTKQMSAGPSLGTSMGAVKHDPVGTTSFTRCGSSPDVLAIGYHTEERLRELGIIAPPEPNPFPGVGTGYEQLTALPGT